MAKNAELFAFTSLLLLSLSFSDQVRRSDDVSTSSLEALVQQQAALIQTLQTKLAAEEQKQIATENKLNAFEARLGSLEDKQSKAVAFTVRFSGDNIQLSTHTILTFDDLLVNIGNGYSSHTGIFTAPAAGVYAFFLSVMSENTHDPLVLDIMKDGSVIESVWVDGKGDTDDQGSSLVTAHLSAGSKVWVRQHRGDIVRGLYLTVFSGFLVKAD